MGRTTIATPGSATVSVIDSAICTAVLRVFRDFRVSHAGGSLFLADMQDAWRTTGLRTHDLADGIALLEEAGCLRAETHGPQGEMLITLLPAGALRLVSFPCSLRGWLEELGSAIALHSLAHRSRGSAYIRTLRQSLHRYTAAPPDAPPSGSE